MKQRTKDWIDGLCVTIAFLVLLLMSINAWACTAFFKYERISGMIPTTPMLNERIVLIPFSHQCGAVTVIGQS